MRSFALGLLAATVAQAVNLDQELDSGIPETGLNTGPWTAGVVPPLDDMLCVNDYQMAAKNSLAAEDYAYYRTGGNDETSYIRNLEIFRDVILNRFSFADVSTVNLKTSILGYNFATPYFIAPAASAGRAHPGAEANIVKAAQTLGILSIASISATLSIEEIAAARGPNQVMFHQEYIWKDRQRVEDEIAEIEQRGFKALFLTVDNFSVNGIRTRSQRFSGSGGYDSNHEQVFTYEALNEIRELTSLPVVPKGVTSASEVKALADMGFPAVYISNHGGRMIDGAPTAIEILLDLHANYPEVFDQIEIYADGGVRRATHVLTLLALGCRAVGLGRASMFANVFGQEGIEQMFKDFRLELVTTMKNMGQSNINAYRGNTTFINTKAIEARYFGAPLSSGTTAKRDVFFHPEPIEDARNITRRGVVDTADLY